MKKWRFINSGSGSAPWNMSVDEALIDSFWDNPMQILRIYSWDNSVSFGRFSNIYNNIKKEKLDTVSYSRRVTGGGILVHGGDISYSMAVPKSFINNFGVKESYRYLCSFLLDFYDSLDLDVKFAFQTDIKSQSSEVCLEGNEPYDIILEGKKLGGNAQRYTKNVLFQHGSIPVRFDKKLFEPLFVKSSGIENSVCLSQAGINRSNEELKEILKKSFCKSFGCTLVGDKLTTDENQRAKKLFEDKYSLDSWNIDGKFNSKKA